MSKPKQPTTFLVSDESINSYRCRVLSSGGDITAFESNPVMLYMHQRGNVVGRWENIRLEDGKWYADAVFDLQDDKPVGGKEIGGKVERGFLKAASLGINVLEVMYNEALDCYDIVKWTVQEISIVDIGSNANALQLYDKAGEPITELKLTAYMEQFKAPTQPDNFIPTNQSPMEIKKILLAMGLPETATEAEALTLAATNQAAAIELAALKLTNEQNQANTFETLVNTAISEKRLAATLKDNFMKLYKADADLATQTLAGLPKPVSLVNLASPVATELTDDDAAEEYDKLDREDKLLKLAAQNPEKYKSLYKAKFGKEPDKVFAK